MNRGPTTALADIPDEVLGEILRSYMDLFPVQHQSNFEAMYVARNTLSLVCHRWHRAIISTPQVWSFLGIDIDRQSPQLSIIGTWLRRVGSVPMNLLASGEERPSREVQRYVVEVFRVIFRRRPLWRLLILDIGVPLSTFLPTIPLHQATGLEAVKLNVHGYNAVGFGVLLDTVISVPSLRKLTLECSPLERVFNTRSLSFAQLTHLTIATVRVSASQLLAILRLCFSAKMVDITAEETTESASELENEEIIIHSHIRILNLDLNGVGYEIFRYFDFPNLEVLHHGEHFSVVPDAQRTLGSLEEWIRRSKHSLRILRLRNPDISAEQLGLSLFPEVEQISIVEIQTTNPDEADQSPSFEDRMVGGIYVMNIPHLHSSGLRSFGWALPGAYAAMDDYDLLAWGPEVYLLIIFGRMMWLASTELAQMGQPASTWDVNVIFGAFEKVQGTGIDQEIRRAQEATAHRSQPSIW